MTTPIPSATHHAGLICALASSVLLALVGRVDAADFRNLPVVKPVMSCDQLAKADVSHAAGAAISIRSAAIRDTPKGSYCRITGEVAPSIGFVADLPIEHWTQRYLQGAQGHEGIERAGSCMPALNGEIAVATDDMGHAVTAPDSPWGEGPTQRIDWAYLANHMTAVALKGIIRVFYGQPQKYAYMLGCSEGGRESLMEAERYPDDFDGISAGAPVVYDSVHNVGFYHGWEYHADQRADGSIVMTSPKLALLHAAVIQHCAAPSGVIDAMLQQPTACQFDKSWVQCAADTSDTSNCLTAEEANVAEQLYLGANDGHGHYFEISGFPLGSELQWRPSAPGSPSDREALSGNGLHRVFMPPLSGQDTKTLSTRFAFTQEWFDRTLEMAPLFNAGNTNLRPFAQHGDKLIMWEGAEDTTVQPAVPISYWEGVQTLLGTRLTQSFMRFFLLPGVGHCGNAEGPNQIDTLSPLMAWVELHRQPKMLVAGRTVPAAQSALTGPGGPNAPGAAPMPGQARILAVPAYPPFALPAQSTLYTRPIYPFPHVARYRGTGNANDAASYDEVNSSLPVPQRFDHETAVLLGPDTQRFYDEVDGLLVVHKAH